MKEKSFVKKNYIDYVNKIIKNDKVSHCYLVEIDNYDDDLKYVYDFIKMILCKISYEKLQDSDNNIIKLIDSGNYPDIMVIEPDGNVIKKGQLLDLQKEFSNKSLFENKRIYIIKNCEKLNLASANTILKFLEEPEEDIIAFLLTNNRYKIIDTIVSRCQILNLREERLLDTCDDELIDLLKAILTPEYFYKKYNYFLNNIIVDKTVANDSFIKVENIIVSYLNYKYKSDVDNPIYKVFDGISDESLISKISTIEQEISKLDYNVNYKLWLDCLFSKLSMGG